MPEHYKRAYHRPASSKSSGVLFSIPFFLLGLALIVTGFVVLAFVNRDASNLPGLVAPVLLVGGYAFVLLSLLVRPGQK